FWVCSIIGAISSFFGIWTVFTNPFSTQLFGKADWWHAVLAVAAVSLAIVPILYVIGARTARDVPLPPEAQAVAGATPEGAVDIPDALTFIASEEIDYVRFEQPDLHGLSRGKTIPSRHFERFALEGLNFLGGLLGLDLQGGVASGTGYLEERNFADSLIHPDLATLRRVPWADRTARVVADPRWYDGAPLKAAPRYLAQEMLSRLTELGYTVRSGFEYEVYFIDAETRHPTFDGIQIFWSLRNSFDQDFVTWMLDSLHDTGVDVITSNAEYGPGQMEINFAPASGVAAADHAFVFKSAIKEMAQQAGYMASFMTKPYADQSA